MDYNFFVTQSHGVVDPRRRELFREQVLQTYLDYFMSNYTGNRAPLNIGHHFFDYQDGAYKEALKAFARTVCGLPEVRCATYSELADFMDQQSPATVEAYRKGDFPHATIAPELSVSRLEATADDPCRQAESCEAPRLQGPRHVARLHRRGG